MNKEKEVFKASLHLVRHFKDCLERERNGFPKGIHSRVFNFMLHPEGDFVGIGRSQAVIDGAPAYPEHVVPCAKMIEECCRLIKSHVEENHIAMLLSKHWKIAYISKSQAAYIDFDLKLKNEMPKGWSFEDGETYERLNLAGIDLLPLDD